MFDDLRRRRGVGSYLAHNMTVTPENLDQVAEVVSEVSRDGLPDALVPAGGERR